MEVYSIYFRDFSIDMSNLLSHVQNLGMTMEQEPTFSSSRVKPRPALILVLYLKVGQRTMGRRAPATGRGAI